MVDTPAGQSIPTFDTLLTPTLEAIRSLGGSASIAEIDNRVIESLARTVALDPRQEPTLDKAVFESAFRSSAHVQGLTHDFYKYPARFSPQFVQLILDNLTQPGDYVLDPFMGGGTTIIEAIASGRRAIGSDLNELSHFVSTVKIRLH